MLDRRGFLTYLGVGTYSLMQTISQLEAASFPLARRRHFRNKVFSPIQPSLEDKLILPRGFKYSRVASVGDALESSGPLGKESFGDGCDLNVYFPIDALTGGKNSKEGLLWVNHEYPQTYFLSQYRLDAGKKTAEQIQKEKLSVGGSVLHVKKERTGWVRVKSSPYTRRFCALYPEIETTGPVSSQIGRMKGTLANCSGGRTLWNTVLTCEENFEDFNQKEPIGYGWSDVSSESLDEVQYGWVVEIDPFGKLPPLKHTSLGRFSHENTAMRLGKDNRLVVYMGDDAQDQYLYKFVSSETWKSSQSRQEQRELLSKGTLYAADFSKGKWIALDIERQSALKEAGFKSQADVLKNTRKAASALKATPIDRPEDCEVHPLDGSVYVALTNNKKHGNLFGQILRIVEDGDNAEAEAFKYELFLAGGPQSGLGCPDNLCFDKSANLWVTCDISSSELNSGPYKGFGNNGFFMVPTQGPSVGDAYQFASGPVESELTGPWFNESGDTLFLSVQHPGETSEEKNKVTSHWPDGGSSDPKSTVVAITGF